MTGAVVAGLLAGWAIAVPVGAVGAYLVGLSARTSWRTGAAAALGVATADGLYALVAVLSGAAVAPVVARAAGPLRWVSAGVLFALAVHGVLAACRTGGRDDEVRLSPRRAFLRLLALTLVNPATVLYFSALVVGMRSAGDATLPSQLVFAASATAASASWQLLLAASGAALGRALTGRRGRLATALVSGAVMAALAVGLLVR